MPYLNETGLSYYDPKLKEWIGDQPVKTIPSSLYPWTLTDKAGAIGVWPVGGTPLLPTVDFMFAETGPASGDKGPENPSTISGVSEVKVTRCGKNLIKAPYYQTSGEDHGITYTVNQDGSITANGTATSVSRFYIQNAANSIFLHKDISYVLSGCPSGGSSSTYFLRLNSFQSARDTGSSVLIAPQTDTLSGNIAIVISDGTTVSNLVFKPQLELGSTATAFEPYDGADYTVDLGGTYYGGSIDLATGVMTVTHVAVTPDASTVDISSAPAALPLDYADTFGRTITSADGTSLVVGSTGGTVVYKLATPQTVQLDPTEILSLPQPDKYTPRLNTVYTDASAVQVGYVKSPIREEYELQQAVVAQGGNV